MLDAVVDYLPSPLDVPPVDGVCDRSIRTQVLTRKADDKEPFSALVFKIMTDPYVGQLAFFRVYSGVLDSGDSVSTTWPRAAKSASAACCACMPTSARRFRRSARATSPRPWVCGRFRPAIPSAMTAPDRARVDRVPDAGDPACGRAEDEGGPGKAGHGDSEAGPGRSHVPRQHRSGDRADDPLRYGRAAPGNHRRPHDARIRRRRQCRQAAGGLSRDDPAAGGSRRTSHQADRAAAASMASRRSA